jgi:CheY-like chemotaxis protein
VTNQARRWARIRPEHRQGYPVTYQRQWFRIVERHDPDIPTMPGQVWLDLAGGPQQVQAAHFEIIQRSRPRILVVDDDPSIRQTLHIALSKTGYEVFYAPDGEEATRLWRETGPDLVIADIHMPRKSGLLLMQELQSGSSSTRVIAMTDGGPTRQFNLMGLAELLGAVRTIAKPFTLDEMVALVKHELGRM